MTAATVEEVLAGERHPHELPWPLWLLWSDGFRAGCQRMQPKLDRANRDADVYYDLAFNGDAARKRHSELVREFDVAQHRRSTAERWAELDRVAAGRAEAARG